MALKLRRAHIHHDGPLCVVGQGLSPGSLILCAHHLFPFLDEKWLSILPSGSPKILLIKFSFACPEDEPNLWTRRLHAYNPFSDGVLSVMECASAPASVLISRLAYTCCAGFAAPAMLLASKVTAGAPVSCPSAHSRRILNHSLLAPAGNLYRRPHCLKLALLVKLSGTTMFPTSALD